MGPEKLKLTSQAQKNGVNHETCLLQFICQSDSEGKTKWAGQQGGGRILKNLGTYIKMDALQILCSKVFWETAPWGPTHPADLLNKMSQMSLSKLKPAHFKA